MTTSHITESLTVDRAVELLSSARRRRLLRYMLGEVDTWVDREELAQTLDSASSESTTLAAGLTHHHLPKLAAAGVIEYDRRSGAVRPTDAVETLRPLLEACEELEESR